MKMTAELVGGPMDGELIDFPAPRMRYVIERVVEPPPEAHLPYLPDELAGKSPRTVQGTYLRRLGLPTFGEPFLFDWQGWGG